LQNEADNTDAKDRDWLGSDYSGSEDGADSDVGIRRTSGKRMRVLESDSTDDEEPASRPKVLKKKPASHARDTTRSPVAAHPAKAAPGQAPPHRRYS
jgi:hypothetical protein